MRRRPQRLIAAAVLAAISLALAGCSSGSFDPTDMMDWFDTKKKLPGERKPVFPEGVPGVEQGVPKDLYRGAQQQPDQPPVAEAPPPAPEPKARSRKSGSKSTARSVAPAAAPSAEPDAPGADEGVAAAPPAPPPAKRKRTSVTAPPPESQPPQAAPPPPQQSSSPFPAPLPSGGFAR